MILLLRFDSKDHIEALHFCYQYKDIVSHNRLKLHMEHYLDRSRKTQILNFDKQKHFGNSSLHIGKDVQLKKGKN